jgi:ATP-dependent Lon protease
VLFIATANTLETIPAPLRDRMEIIQISGYTHEEKSEIAKRYLLPKQLKANGLKEKSVKFAADGLKFLIEGYTLEAGVRNLERQVGSLCRKIAVKTADDESFSCVTLHKSNVEELLGSARFKQDEKRKKEEVGAVTGLAWTAVGGTTLTVEATTVKGKGEIRLTGKLGDVMKESAFAAFTYIRANAERYGIDSEVFEKTDIHIHVPEGATPKDGPSAGITMATAILSVFTDRKVKKDVAMTGEITLRGKVLPIGGLKEKSLAARRIGIKNVIIPIGNVKDVEEIPETVRKDIRFIPVENVDEVFAIALSEPEITKNPSDNGCRAEVVKPRVTPIKDSSEQDSIRCRG